MSSATGDVGIASTGNGSSNGGNTNTISRKAKWGPRLETKLNGLLETSSKETYQTIAKWIAFNRKRFDNEFSTVLRSSLCKNSTNGTKSLQLVHEMLVDERPSGSGTIGSITRKWDRLSDLRISVGENVILPIVDQMDHNVKEKLVDNFMNEWDEANVFSGPTLINQIKRKLQSSTSTSTTTTIRPAVAGELTISSKKNSPENEPSDVMQSSSPTSDAAALNDATGNNDVVFETDEPTTTSSDPIDNDKGNAIEDTNAADPVPDTAIINVTDTSVNVVDDSFTLLMSATKTLEESNNASLLTMMNNKDGTTSYDFEAMDIPESKVDPKEFLDNCKSIATFQIARDLRNDGAVQLSSLLSSMPEDIRKLCLQVSIDDADNSSISDSIQIPEAKARDFALRLNNILLDMDLSEQLQNVQTFHEIIQRQKLARETLIRLLITSRCKFGSYESATILYEDAEDVKEQLWQRSQILMDAMELEGFDMEEMESNDDTMNDKNKKRKTNADEAFAPLVWYKSPAATPSTPMAQHDTIE